MNIIKALARKSPLSKAQVEEIKQEFALHYSNLLIDAHFIDTQGDLDKKTSLRGMDKTNFFTKEIDLAVWNKSYDLGIHSAKDLPSPMPQGLMIAAITRGLDPSDSLVLRKEGSLRSLPFQAKIATSSPRRDAAVKMLRSDFSVVDIRGTIEERLAYLQSELVDGIVVAEAALIRLGLTHLPRIRLPGETTPFQGQLALVAREDDFSTRELCQCLDSRTRSYT